MLSGEETKSGRVGGAFAFWLGINIGNDLLRTPWRTREARQIIMFILDVDPSLGDARCHP